MEKREDTEETKRVPWTELTTDHRSYLENKVTNTDVLKWTGQRRLQDIVGERRLRFAGHVIRMAPECPAHSAVVWIPVDCRRRRQTKEDLAGGQHFVTTYMQEESAGARRGTSGRSCTLVTPAVHCPENGPQELSAK